MSKYLTLAQFCGWRWSRAKANLLICRCWLCPVSLEAGPSRTAPAELHFRNAPGALMGLRQGQQGRVSALWHFCSGLLYPEVLAFFLSQRLYLASPYLPAQLSLLLPTKIYEFSLFLAIPVRPPCDLLIQPSVAAAVCMFWWLP